MRWRRPTSQGVEALAARGGALGAEPFGRPVRDFYLTNPIARASAVMAELSALEEEHRARDHGNAWLSAWSWPEIWQGYLWPLLVMAFWSVLLLVALLVCVAFLLLMDRKVWAAVQLRRGPNVVGPFGLLQSFADLLKFVLKEPLIPAGADKGVFLLAPLVASVLALAAWAVIPVNEDGWGRWVISDLNVGILYLFAISSLGVYGVIMGGWASNSKYRVPGLAAVGRADGVLRGLDRLRHHHGAAVRRLAQHDRHRQRAEDRHRHALRAAELGARLALARRCFRCSSCSSSRRWPRPTGRRSTCRRRNRSWWRASWWNTRPRPTCCSCWASTWPSSPCARSPPSCSWAAGCRRWRVRRSTWVPGIFWFMGKLVLVFFMFAMVKAFVPRYRYDQLMRLGWKVFLPLSLIMVVAVAGVLQFFDLAP